MANDNVENIEKATAAEVPRMQMTETGFVGLKVSAGRIHEDIKRELNFPESITTYKQMSYDPTIAAGLQYFESMMQKPRWHVLPPKNATEEEERQAEIVEEMMHDMEHTWNDLIKESSSMNTYGFSVHEVVLRKRLRSKGSKYNDGLVGWQKLPVRSQDTISEWIFSDDGRELIGLQQSPIFASGNGRVFSAANSQIILPRKKFLLFRTGTKRDNPEGVSLLKSCYYPWKYRTAIEETEAVGIQRDLSGLPVIYLPPQYMAPDATAEQKAVYETYKNIVRNIQLNQQGGIVMPQAFDPETKQPLFKFELMGVEGGKSYKTTEIIGRYNNAILTAMCCDVLTLGQSATGSYALGSIKSTMTSMTIESRLREIRDVVNHHLIPLTAEYNGWDIARLPQIGFEDIEVADLEAISKYVQRIGAVGYLPRTKEVVNKVLDGLGLEPLADNVDLDEVLPESKSRSGDGMQEGMGNGTGDAEGQSGDSSANNNDNTA